MVRRLFANTRNFYWVNRDHFPNLTRRAAALDAFRLAWKCRGNPP